MEGYDRQRKIQQAQLQRLQVIEGRFETVWDDGGRSTVNEWVAWLEKDNGPKPKILLPRRFLRSGRSGRAESGYVTSRFDFDLRGVHFSDNVNWQTNDAAPWEGWEEVESSYEDQWHRRKLWQA